ncbi:hypothetical protein ACVDG5_020005 [Mesorhizobium sp. ORM6]
MLQRSGSSFSRVAGGDTMPKNGAQISARDAVLTYVSDAEPSIGRLTAGKRFSYRGPDGRPVSGATRARIEAIVIPPAWTDLWISPDANGHIQATGRDQRGASNTAIIRNGQKNATAPNIRTSLLSPKRVMNRVIDKVAERLGNTRAVCRKSYIHPRVFEAWSQGRLLAEMAEANKCKWSIDGLDDEGALVLRSLTTHER